MFSDYVKSLIATLAGAKAHSGMMRSGLTSPNGFLKSIVAALAGCALLFCAFSVYATGPDYQLTNPTQGANLYSVVDFWTANAAGQDSGTGSVIDKMVIGGVGYFCVLTADHVMTAGSSFVSFGNGNPSANIFPYAGQMRLGPGGNEDIAVVAIRYTGNPADAFFTSVLTLGLTTAAPSNTVFSEIGFGDTGIFDAGGLTTQTSHGTQRFQNNLVTSLTLNAATPYNRSDTALPYTEDILRWTFDKQGTANYTAGEGSSFGGDSGGPYMLSSSTVTNIGGTNITVRTDSSMAVHGFGPIINPRYGSTSGALGLNAADLAWIASACDTIPEPASWLLTAVGVVLLLGGVRRNLKSSARNSASH